MRTKRNVLGCSLLVIPSKCLQDAAACSCRAPTPAQNDAMFSVTKHSVLRMQCEGAVNADGRGTTICDTYSHLPGKIADNSTGDIADDFYHQYLSDISLMQANGIKNFRFSIAWSRIYPAGSGTVSRMAACGRPTCFNSLCKTYCQQWCQGLSMLSRPPTRSPDATRVPGDL